MTFLDPLLAVAVVTLSAACDALGDASEGGGGAAAAAAAAAGGGGGGAPPLRLPLSREETAVAKEARGLALRFFAACLERCARGRRMYV